MLSNKDLKQHVVKAAFDKVISTRANDRYLLHWDRKGICRAFSTIEDNRHWSVPSLKGVAENYSKVLL